jgi:hypothetical protein
LLDHRLATRRYRPAEGDQHLRSAGGYDRRRIDRLVGSAEAAAADERHGCDRRSADARDGRRSKL